MVRFAVILHNLIGGHLYEYVVPILSWNWLKLIRSPGFNRFATRVHSKVQKMKAQWVGTEEQMQKLREQERLLKEAEEKFKSLESETKGIYKVNDD